MLWLSLPLLNCFRNSAVILSRSTQEARPSQCANRRITSLVTPWLLQTHSLWEPFEGEEVRATTELPGE